MKTKAEQIEQITELAHQLIHDLLTNVPDELIGTLDIGITSYASKPNSNDQIVMTNYHLELLQKDDNSWVVEEYKIDQQEG